MNRCSRSDVKHKPTASSPPEEAFDFEAIEAAVKQTARGRWFLSEYLRRHTRNDTRRLLAAVERLAAASATLPAPHPQETEPAPEIHLLLARTADRLTTLHASQTRIEPTLPAAAASRLASVLRTMREAADGQRALAALEVLADAFTVLAGLLNEPAPAADAEPAEEGEAVTTLPATEPPAVSGEKAQKTMQKAAHSSGPAARSRQTATSETASRDNIVIRRRSRSEEVAIPLPDAQDSDTVKPHPDRHDRGSMTRRVRISIAANARKRQ